MGRFIFLAVVFLLVPFPAPVPTVAAADFEIRSGISGSWYDESHDGEGFVIEILDEATALVYWFTYDTEGKQAWFIGVGTISGDRIEIAELYRFSGGEFGPEFDPASVESNIWGSLNFTFASCSRAVAEYSGPPAFGSGQFDLGRLSGIHGMSCASDSTIRYGSTVNGAMSGAWYDPSHDGEGFVLEILDPTTALVYWFTYDQKGNQAWMIGLGAIEGNNIRFEELLQPKGAIFGDQFNPDDVVRSRWGALEFAFGTCSLGRLAYESDVGWGAGELWLNRLSTIQTTKCRGHELPVLINAPPDTDVDGDVNDGRARFVENEEFSQAVPNPLVLGGYVTAVPTEEPGDRFSEEPDTFDGYYVPMAAGQVITLYISDHPGGEAEDPDLDLYLYELSNLSESLSRSITTTDVEQLQVPEDGEYIIQVFAYQGRSNYTLIVDSPGASVARKTLMEREFAPGEIIIRLANGRGLVGEHAHLRSLAKTHDARIREWVAGSASLLELSAGKRHVWPEDESPDGPKALPKAGTTAHLKSRTLQAIKALNRRPGVAYAEPNYVRRDRAVPPDWVYERQWHYPRISLPPAWDLTRGEGVTVAVIDSGVVDHPDLAVNIIEGYDFIADPERSGDGDGLDPDPSDPGHCPNGSESCSFHGTHVAGTVAAAWNDYLGVGVAPSASLVILRTSASGSSLVYDGLQALRYAAGLDNASPWRRSRPVDIINESHGYYGSSQAERETYADAVAAGVMITSAAGNENTDESSSPGIYPGVINVSATDHRDQKAYYSDFGEYVDVAAPGGDVTAGLADGIWSTWAIFEGGVLQTDLYASGHGTSMAAPHMAGVLALMKSVHPDLTLDDVEALLASGRITDDLAGNGPRRRDDFFGYGRINAFKAVEEALKLAGGAVIEPVIKAEPLAVDLGAQSEGADLEVSNIGGGTLNIASVRTAAPWAAVAPVDTDEAGLGIYRVTVDRTGLIPTDYRGEVVISSDTAGELRVPVEMQVVDFSEPPDAGFNYVLLLDVETGLTVSSLGLDYSDGVYKLTIGDVLDGEYRMLVGSDMDRDLFICDPGDACGGYPSLGDLSTITVNGRDRDVVRFSTSFPVPRDAGGNGAKRGVGGLGVPRQP